MSIHPSLQTADVAEFWYRQKVVERTWALAHRYRHRPYKFAAMSEYELNEPELVRNARKFFGTWHNALTAAGVANGGRGNGGDNKTRELHLSKQRLLEIIAGMAASGEDMSAENMIVMHNPLWKAACGRSGYFSHWPTVLRHAGVDHHILGRDPFWTDPRVRNSVIDLYESQQDLSGHFIRHNFWHLYRFGLRHHSSWKAVVDSTGLGYENVMAEHAALEARQDMFQRNLFVLLGRMGRDIKLFDGIHSGLKRSLGPLGLFCTESAENTIIGTIPRAWYHGIEDKIWKIRKIMPDADLELYYLMGEPRTWPNDTVKFIGIYDLIEESMYAGTDKYMRDILTLQYNTASVH